MYAIINWKDDDHVFPILNEDGTLKLYDKLKEADKDAERVFDSRVISIEGVKE